MSAPDELRAAPARLRWRCPPRWLGDAPPPPLRGEAEVVAALEAFVRFGRTLALVVPSGWSFAPEIAAWLAGRVDGPVVLASAGGGRRWRGKAELGVLARAHGGVVVADLRDLDAPAWEALREALETGAVEPEPGDDAAPPRPAAVRVVLCGPDAALSALRDKDDRFGGHFAERVAAWGSLPRDRAGVAAVAARLRSVRPDAQPETLAWAVEQVARGARRDRIPDRAQRVERALREAADGSRAAAERAWAGLDARRNTARQAQLDRLRDGVLQVATEGVATGAVNGLMVYAQGREPYVLPGRITAAVGAGRTGVANVEREAKFSGRSFDKGVLQLVAVLRSRWGVETPLDLAASVAFEQSHGRVDGDSATLAAALALLSELALVPARQDVAVTGALGQRGEVQSVGSVTLKVEGWWRACRVRGLTGTQGVALPASGLDDLQLDRAALADVRRGRFHVWAVADLDEAAALVLHLPDGPPLHERVRARLEALGAALKGKSK